MKALITLLIVVLAISFCEGGGSSIKTNYNIDFVIYINPKLFDYAPSGDGIIDKLVLEAIEALRSYLNDIELNNVKAIYMLYASQLDQRFSEGVVILEGNGVNRFLKKISGMTIKKGNLLMWKRGNTSLFLLPSTNRLILASSKKIMEKNKITINSKIDNIIKDKDVKAMLSLKSDKCMIFAAGKIVKWLKAGRVIKNISKYGANVNNIAACIEKEAFNIYIDFDKKIDKGDVIKNIKKVIASYKRKNMDKITADNVRLLIENILTNDRDVVKKLLADKKIAKVFRKVGIRSFKRFIKMGDLKKSIAIKKLIKSTISKYKDIRKSPLFRKIKKIMKKSLLLDIYYSEFIARLVNKLNVSIKDDYVVISADISFIKPLLCYVFLR